LVGGLVIVALGLFIVPSLLSGSDSNDTSDTSGVPCIYSEVFHIHPHLQILVDGKEEAIPAGIGIEPGCTRELHTHEPDGEIHIEAAKDRGYKFSGYTLKMTVDDAETTDTGFVMKDKQHILLNYTKIQ